jgi:hypothetical protein
MENRGHIHTKKKKKELLKKKSNKQREIKIDRLRERERKRKFDAESVKRGKVSLYESSHLTPLAVTSTYSSTETSHPGKT